jgi:aspartate racemase
MFGMNRILGSGRTRVLGVIGGIEPMSGADFLLRLAEATQAAGAASSIDIIFEQQHATGHGADPKAEFAARQMYLFDRIEGFRARGASVVVLPGFASLAFMQELKANSPLPIADMVEALLEHVQSTSPQVRRIGVLTTPELQEDGLFERYFGAAGIAVCYPARDVVQEGMQPAEALYRCSADLVRRGAQLLLPAIADLAIAARHVPLGMPLIDAHQVYARYVAVTDFAPPLRPFKLGVVGGVGPAATVDFLEKFVRHTPAQRDQDHIKVMVEQNPQIPDRTDYLLGKGVDPTLALYATCRKLQAGEADLIAIPCNTAHAFVDRIQPHLDVPILNMLTITVGHIRELFPTLRMVGLLATSGTLASGIYRQSLEAQGLEEITPPPQMQQRVMNAIYGPEGVKAGFTAGQCMEDLSAAIDDLAARGARVIILGCTELPLVYSSGEGRSRGGHRVLLVDPTEILAIRCVAWARDISGPRLADTAESE